MRDADIADFEHFARARAAALYRSAWLMSGDRHEAEDLVQDTLAKVFLRWRRPFGGRIENPAAYAQTTLARTFISRRRRRSSTEQTRGEQFWSAMDERGGGDESEHHVMRLELQDALGALAPVDRAVLVLRYLEDLDVEQTAERLGLTPGAVRNRSMRALARMRERSRR